MALTTIDATPALVVIDLQKGIVALPTAHPVDDVVRNSAELAAAFRRRGFPVVLVNVDGGRAWSRPPAPPTSTATTSSWPPTR